MLAIPTISVDYAQRLQRRQASAHHHLWQRLDQVNDPEIPVLSIWDLGILQDITVEQTGTTVVITPTYSGCPAMREVQKDIHKVLEPVCGDTLKVQVRLSPAWTTDWMSPQGKQQLRDYGIAPPERNAALHCPQCGSADTVLISEFGSTACKALFRCLSCSEPFDHFKCI
jgi:ring-1,2-phenylacetyl-CoA epoxidase subunit PaaD